MAKSLIVGKYTAMAENSKSGTCTHTYTKHRHQISPEFLEGGDTILLSAGYPAYKLSYSKCIVSNKNESMCVVLSVRFFGQIP